MSLADPAQHPRRLTLYSRPGCHLCDEMKSVVALVASRANLAVEEVNIEGDTDLEDRYGLEVPVLMIDGRKAAKYRVTEGELEEKLRRRPTPEDQ